MDEGHCRCELPGVFRRLGVHELSAVRITPATCLFAYNVWVERREIEEKLPCKVSARRVGDGRLKCLKQKGENRTKTLGVEHALDCAMPQPCPLQEDVSRLRSAFGKSGKCVLSNTMAILRQVAFWSHCIDEYMSTATAMVREGPVVRRHMLNLEKLQHSIGELSVLESVLEDLPRLKACLRPGTMQPLLEMVQSGIEKSWDQNKEAFGINPDAVAHFSKVLVHACVQFPFDGALAQMQLDCGQLLQEVDQSALIKKVILELGEFGKVCKETSNEEKKVVIEKTEKLSELLQSTSLPIEQWKSVATSSESKTAFQCLLDNCVAEMGLTIEQTPSGLVASSACLGQLSEKLAREDQLETVKCIRLVSDFVQQQRALQGHVIEDDGASDEHAEKLGSLKRAMVLVEECKSKATKLSPEVAEKLKKVMEKAKPEVEETCKAFLEDGKTLVQKSLEELKQLAGGKEGGADWLADFQGTKLEDYMERAEVTLFKLQGSDLVQKKKNLAQAVCANWKANPVALVTERTRLSKRGLPLSSGPNVNIPITFSAPFGLIVELVVWGLCKALATYRGICNSLSVEPAKTLIDEAESVHKTACITKACACLLHFFKTEASLELLRQKTQAELREMNNQNLVPKQTLPKAISNRADLALALRKK
eukprot:6491527-Amphidinium_carterae.3